MGYFDDQQWLPEWKAAARSLANNVFEMYLNTYNCDVVEIIEEASASAPVVCHYLTVKFSSAYSFLGFKYILQHV